MNQAAIGRSIIGRTRALVLSGMSTQGKAIVVQLSARAVALASVTAMRLDWRGSVHLDCKAMAHLQSVVLPTVDHLCGLLGVPPQGYLLSIANPSAAASHDLGVRISGSSADVPVFLALLSAALQLPLPRGLASSGQLASTEGDIATVRGLPEKIAAALDDGNVTLLLLPDVEADCSLRLLAPNEHQAFSGCIASARERLEIHLVRDVGDLVRFAFNEESMAQGSLARGYFSRETPNAAGPHGPVELAADCLRRNNEHRFWRSLEARLTAGDIVAAKSLLSAYAEYHLKAGSYPSNLGTRLRALMISLPPTPRRQAGAMLLPMQACIALSSLATGQDYPDVQLLFQVRSGTEAIRAAPPDAVSAPERASDDQAGTSLERLFSKISSQAVAEQVTLPLDEARARYQLDGVIANNVEQFHDTLIGFYVHMLRHTHEAIGRLDRDALLGEVLEILECAFVSDGGYRAARAEALDGTHGGLRLVLDRLTDQMKREKTERYLRLAFTEAIDPLDWDAKVRLICALLERLRPYLPPELPEQPPERYAVEYERIVRAYAESLERVTRLLKTL